MAHQLSSAQIIQASFEGLLCLAAVAGNLCVICLIVSTRELRKSTNFLIVNLCSPGVAAGALVMPLQIAADFDLYPELPYICVGAHSLVIVINCWMVFGLVAVVAERHYAVFFPLAYAIYFTTRNVGLITAAVVGVSFVLGVYPMVHQANNYRVIASCSFHHAVPYAYGTFCLCVYMSSFVAVAVAYSRIIVVVRRQSRCIAAQMIVVRGISSRDAIDFSSVHVANETSALPPVGTLMQQHHRKELRTTVFLTATIFYFFFSSLPIFVCLMMMYNGVHPGKIVLISAIILASCFHVINPIIFGLGYRKFREHMLEALKCKKRNP